MPPRTVCVFDHLAESAGLSNEKQFPETTDDYALAEKMLARELEALSLEEREKIVFDMHGLHTTSEEDPPDIELKVKQVEVELAKIQDKEAYLKAKHYDEDYATNGRFVSLFLRTAEFDPAAAAAMIVGHFRFKKQIFGDGEILGRDVRQSDLSETDLKFMDAGYQQFLPSRDASGRSVMCISGDFAKQDIIGKHMRAFWYFGQLKMRDEDTLRKGTVWVLYHKGNIKEELSLFHAVRQNFCAVMPHRVAAGHFCFNDPSVRPYLAGFQLRSPKSERFRVREHMGSAAEIEFELQTFGIPIQEGPMQKDGTWSNTLHKEWLRMLRTQEEQEQEASSAAGNTEPDVLVPRRFDVLLGKTKKSLAHTGNRRLVFLCEMNYKQYCLANKHKKTEISQRIVSIIHESEGRFLKWEDKTGWREVTELDARNKVAHSFRHYRARVAKMEVATSPLASSSDSNQDTDHSSSEFSVTDEKHLEKRASPVLQKDVAPTEKLPQKRGRHC